MKLLYLTSRLPYPPIGGDRLRTFAFIKYLSQNHTIDLVSLYDNDRELNHIDKLSVYCSDIYLFKRNKIFSLYNLMKSFLNRKPFQVNYYKFPEVAGHIREIYSGYDCVIVHLLRMAEYVMDLPVKKFIDMTDCLSESWATQSSCFAEPLKGLFKLESRFLRNYENLILERFDRLFFVTENDANLIGKGEKIVVVKNGLNIEESLPDKEIDKDKYRIYIGFVGKLSTVPNRDAVNFFIDEIFPKIREEIRDAKFLIIGQNPSLKWELRDNCVVTGEVPDIRKFLLKCAVFVCPLRAGTGFKNKVVEAMLLKIPVVATSASVDGMGFIDGEHLLVADSPELFADKVVELINDRKLGAKLARNAYLFVKENFDWSRELDKVDKVLCSTT